MNALVTGGAGFIGSNLVGELVRKGHSVTVLDNLSSGYLENLSEIKGVRFWQGDICSADDVALAMQSCDLVFHLAASVGNKRSIDNPIRDAEVNVLGTINVLEQARRQRDVRKVVMASSAGIFGELKYLPIDEEHPAEPDSPYGATKLASEKLGLLYARMYPFDVIALRYFNVYGRNQRFDAYGNVIPIFTFKLLRGETLEVFGDGEQTRDFIHVDDLVQANMKAAEADGVSGAFNIGSGATVTINTLISLLGRVSGQSPNVLYSGRRLGDVLDSCADISKARNLLDFRPSVNIEQGVEDYVGWTRSVL